MAASSKFSIAVHVLALLAKGDDENIKSDCLAKSVNTNAVVIRRLLCNLQEARMVASQTGAGGGSRLTRRPKDIRLSDVYRAVTSGEVFALHPNTPDQLCPVGKNIQTVLENLQTEIDLTIEQKLAQYTLRDIIESVEEEVLINC
ncbi:MAG: Rrf2 family transcriptional regulator [Pyrinomonadaceae bacterium]